MIILVPICLLTWYGGVKAKLIIVSSFVSLFSLIMATATCARSWEVVAATAAYVYHIVRDKSNDIC
jgi:hypothetical protein